MMTFEKVLDIFADYLALDCSGMVCCTPKELFDLLLSDYESYLEIQRTKGRRDVTKEDQAEIAALCQSRLEKWEKGNAI